MQQTLEVSVIREDTKVGQQFWFLLRNGEGLRGLKTRSKEAMLCSLVHGGVTLHQLASAALQTGSCPQKRDDDSTLLAMLWRRNQDSYLVPTAGNTDGSSIRGVGGRSQGCEIPDSQTAYTHMVNLYRNMRFLVLQTTGTPPCPLGRAISGSWQILPSDELRATK